MYIMENLTYPQRKRTPSFSSSLLDSIYRSIDESKSNLDVKETNNNHTNLKHINLSLKHNNNNNNHIGACDVVDKSGNNNKERMRMNLRRSSMMLEDDWIEKQSTRSSQFMMNSSITTSTSSESSYGGGTSMFFSSSETDTTTRNHIPRPRSSSKPEIIRHVLEKNHQNQKKPKHEGGSGTTSFARTKLRALRIYGAELNQKVRHPISPGSRIASFLSSIFNSGNAKKTKMCYVGAVEDVTFEHKSNKSPCFSSSSTASNSSLSSRKSCMSKAPSSGKGGNRNNNGVKRSVRFYPVCVILGEDSHHQLLPSCQRHSNYDENDPSLLPLHSGVRKIARGSSSIKELKKSCVMPKGNSIGVMKGCHNSGKGNIGKFGFRGFCDDGDGDIDYDEDDDDCDALSYSSSDLFELDHIIGAGRYQEELPVYETTNVETNMAIANGLSL